MKHKKLFLTIAAVLHFCAYSMEKSIIIPEGYFRLGDGYLPLFYENDGKLRNIYFCPDTNQYKIKEYIKETLENLSKFPEFEETRSLVDGWRDTGIGTGTMERIVKTHEKNQKEAYINLIAIFLKPRK